MKKTVIMLLVLLMALLGATAAQAYYPTRDGFNIYSSGTVRISGSGINAVAVQSWDGKVLIGGSFSATGSGSTVKNLARINMDGTLDTAFAPAPDGPVNAIAIQPDRSGVYIGGSFSNLGAQGRNGLAHLDPTGAPDGFNPASQPDTVINSIVLQSGGILVGGRFGALAGKTRNNLAAINSDGTVPETFPAGTNGDVLTVLQLSDGTIVAGGSFSQPQGKLARFDASGVYDASFSFTPPDTVRALAQQVDGKILLGGDFTAMPAGSQTLSYLARLSSDWTLDSGFNPGPNGSVTSLALQADGKILVGGNFTMIGSISRNHFARLNIAGTLDYNNDPHNDLNPNTDAVVNAIAVQPDGKFLMAGNFRTVAGGGKPRTRLARYYPTGALDEDYSSLFGPTWGFPLGESDFALSMAQLPNGTDVLIGGALGPVDGVYSPAIARLNPDWTLASNPDNVQLAFPLVLLPQPDGKVILTEGALTDGYLPSKRLNADGTLDTTYNNQLGPNAGALSMTMLRPGTKLPDGTPLEDGMFYVGGGELIDDNACFVRVKSGGSIDQSFHAAPELCHNEEGWKNGSYIDNHWAVTAIVIQPDNKVVVANEYGEVMRLLTDGSRDTSFQIVTLDGVAHALVLMPDGQHIWAFGDFTGDFAQIDLTGKVDQPFTLTTIDDPSDNEPGVIWSADLQTDGNFLLGGNFAKINGVIYDHLARLLPTGQVDPSINLGVLGPNISFAFKVVFVRLQPDGKLIMSGAFDSINGDHSKAGLSRLNYGWATQNLSVSPDGSTVTWLRGGVSPELWRVWIEHSADGVNWQYLGEATRTAALDGWYLGGLNAFPTKENHYVRARGYVAGELGSAGTLLESVRMFYLQPAQAKPVLTITASPASKTYGASDPVFAYTASGFVNGDTSALLTGSLGRSPGNGVGSYAINQGDLSAGSNYTISLVPANLTITPVTLTVVADNKSRSYGQANPPLTYTASGFVNGDGVSVLSGTPALSTAAVAGSAVGSYPISAAAGSLSAANYTFAYASGSLTVNPVTLTITADNKSKSYGQANPALTYTASGFVNGDGVSALTGTPALSTAALADSPVGSYPISAGPGTLSAANYTFSCLNGTMSVTQATLTVIADSKSKTCGAADPPLTFSISGFVNGDSSALLTGCLSRVAGEGVGSYPITQWTLSAGPNYSIAFTAAALEIDPVGGPLAQTITFNALRARTYGDADFDPGATASSNLPVSYASSDTGIAAVVGSKVRVLAPGAATITAAQGGDAQYQAAPSVSQPLTVNPPPWNALGFDGIDDLMRVADAPQLNFGAKGGFTIEAWLHLDGSQPDGTGIVSKGEGGSAWSGYQLLLQQNRIAAEMGTGSASVGIPEGLIGTSNLNDGQWHHVALTVDRTQQRADLYLDGRLEAEVTNAALAGTPDNTDPLQAGVDRSGTRFFKGGMDELRLWDTARSRDDLRAAQSQIIDPLNEQHLVAYFHFDEGDVGQDNASFATAPERTAFGATGTLQGFALSGSDSNWVRSGAFLPLLESTPVSGVDTQSASGGGTVYPNYYPPTDTGLCWGATPNPGLSDSCLHAGSGVGPFAGSMGGLAPGTTYHVRAFATNQMGTAFGNDLSFQTARLSQTIVGEMPAKTYGDTPFYPNCSATSGLPVSYTSANPSVAVVVNGELQITGAGSATITASQGGNSTYQPAAGTFTLTVARAQLLVVADDKGRAYQTPNPPFTVSYRGFVNGDGSAALSGSAVLTTSATPTSPVGDYDIVVALGTLAAQNYALVPLDGTLSVFKSCQQIIFPAISDLTYGDPPLQLTASTCSGLTISFTSSNPQVGQVSGGTLTITGAGSVVITASQQGGDSLEKAPDVSQTVTVRKSGQLISFPSLPGKLMGDPPFTLGATASSGLTVGYQSSDPAVATVNGSQLTLTGAGTVVITATQGGNSNYNPANPVSQPLTVAIEGNPPQLTLSTLPSGAVTADPVLNVAGTASAPSGLAGVEVNGSELAGQGALFSSAVPLTAGENNVSVSARDVFGNKATQTVSVTFDATAPAIVLSAPADNSVTDQPIIAVSGTVSAGSAVRLTVNGGAPQDVAVTDGSFTATGSLVEGLNTVLVSAELAGRLSQVKRSVLLAAGKPYVAITDPAEDLRTEQQSLTLKGVAGSQAGEVSLVLEVNGNTLTPSLQSGSFQQLIPLDQAGPTSIAATVTDGSGATSVARRNVIKVTKILGDLNGDGLVDLRDALAALRISLGLDPATPEALAHGDVAPLVNGVPQTDGKIDVGDVLLILRKVVGLVDF